MIDHGSTIYALDCLHTARTAGAVAVPSRKRCARCRAQRNVIMAWKVDSDSQPTLELVSTGAQQGASDLPTER